jgi:glycosyltransferase involved in cell wall biosynthesis
MRTGLPRVVVVSAAWTGYGGLQQSLRELVVALAAERTVTVLTWAPRWPSSHIYGHVRVVCLPCPFDWTREHGAVAAAVNTAATVAVGWVVLLLLGGRDAPVVAAGLHPEATPALLAGRRVIAATWLVGPLGNVARLQRSTGYPWLRRLVKRVAAFVVETDEAMAEVLSLDAPSTRVHMALDGVDVDRFRPTPEAARDEARAALGLGPAKVLLFAGRFDLRQKRVDLLLDAWARHRVEGWQLVLAGDGPDLGRVVAGCRSTHDAHRLGWIDDAVRVLAAADAFVLPTEAETTAKAVLEAMSCALPSLVSATPGMQARNAAGVTLVANDAESWMAAIHELTAASDDARVAAGRSARAWVEANAKAEVRHDLIKALLA